MKIWLKSPDPNHQCCDCSSKSGPCDFCCQFSGVEYSSVEIKSFYNGNYYVHVGFEDLCINSQNIPAVPTGNNVTTYINGNTRNIQYTTTSLPLSFPDIIDGVNNLYLAGAGSIISNRTDGVSYIPPVNIPDNIPTYFHFYNYSIVSNQQGFTFVAPVNTIQSISEFCDKTAYNNFTVSQISQIQASFSSGEKLILNFDGLVVKNCGKTMGFDINKNPTPFILTDFCNDGPFSPILFFTKNSTGSNIWAKINNHDAIGDFIFDDTFGPNNGFINTRFASVDDARDFCINNWHIPTFMKNLVGTLRPDGFIFPCEPLVEFLNLPIPNFNLCATNFLVGSAPVVAATGFSCCPNGDTNYFTPGYRTVNGKITIDFLSSECVTINLDAKFTQLNIQLFSPNGASANPISRFSSINLISGDFIKCDDPP